MKVNKSDKAGQSRKKITRRELRALEQELGIYLDDPKEPARCINQQFGVYDEDEQFAGDIVAENMHFTLDELRGKIRSLF